MNCIQLITQNWTAFECSVCVPLGSVFEEIQILLNINLWHVVACQNLSMASCRFWQVVALRFAIVMVSKIDKICHPNFRYFLDKINFFAHIEIKL